jgi:hypothetical protein
MVLTKGWPVYSKYLHGNWEGIGNFYDHSIKEMEKHILRDLGWKKIDKVVYAGKCIDLNKSLTSQYITPSDNISGLVFFVTI